VIELASYPSHQVGGNRLLTYLLQGLVLGGTAAAQPGPFQAYLLSQTLKNGWRKTILAAFAPLISDGPIIVLVVLILTQTPDWLMTLLRIGGGFLLLYLAWKAYLGYRAASEKQTAVLDTAVQQSIVEAVLMNFLNPNPYIFWGTIAGPIFLDGWRESLGLGLSFLLGFYGTLVGGFMAYIALFAVARKMDPKVSRGLSLFSAIALFCFGLYQLWSGIKTLLV
jgi:threonine/homoserine/homoserine lactone efflux protein